MEKLAEAERTTHPQLIQTGDDTPIFVATNSRASAIESIYTGIEGILKELLACVGEPVYSRAGDDQHRWHAQLLAQVAHSTDTRPAIISEPLRRELDELRRFRHLDRNIYGHQLQPDRVGELVSVALDAAHRVANEAKTFMTDMTGQWS